MLAGGSVGHDGGVPEGDTIFRAATQLRGALVGKELVELQVRRDPRGRRGPEPGTEITAVDAAGKHLLMRFADGHVLHTHMQMTGAWHLYRPGERWRRPGHTARVVLRVDDGTTAVCFAAPIVELRRDGSEQSTRATRMLQRLGPDLCQTGVDIDTVVARLESLSPETELASALLDQRVAAGIGNVFKSEICWAECIFPFTPIREIDGPARRRIYQTAQHQLTSNLHTTRRTTFANGLAVYRKSRQPCPRCGGTIRTRRDQAERSTYWCPRCQPEPGT
jgi:endonuclease-8